MKRFLLVAAFAACISNAMAQSQSFKTLQNAFAEQDDVHCFTTSGMLARTVLWLAGEHEFKKAIRNVKHIRIMTVPKSAFEDQKLTVHGLQKIIRRDSYEELASVREEGALVTVYLQEIKRSRFNRYLILIDNVSELVALEVKGFIDPTLLNKRKQVLSKQL